MKPRPLEKYLELNEGGIGKLTEMTGDSEIQYTLSMCIGGVVFGCSCTEPVWLFVRETCLKTGSFTGRQDVELWTLGNRAAPSEPGLKQDGFVCAITILLLPSFP